MDKGAEAWRCAAASRKPRPIIRPDRHFGDRRAVRYQSDAKNLAYAPVETQTDDRLEDLAA